MSLRTVSLALVVSCLVNSPIHAAVEIYSRLHDNGGAGYGPLLGPQFGAFNEPQFDDFGGTRTLQKVTLSVRIDSSGGSAEFDNGAPADYIGPLVGTTSTDTDSDFYTTPPELAPYIGAGLVTFNWDGGTSTTGQVLTAGGTRRINFHSLNNYTFRTTLTYEYVPEPSSLVMLLLSGGTLLLRWRT